MKACLFSVFDTLLDEPCMTSAENRIKLLGQSFQVLQASGHKVSQEEFMQAFGAAAAVFNSTLEIDKDPYPHITYLEILDGALTKIYGAGNVDTQVRTKITQIFGDEVLMVQPPMLPKVPEALEYVKQKGLKIGIVSNNTYGAPASLLQILEKHGIAKYFDARVYSSEVGYRKPSPRIFEEALQRLGNLPPNEVIHIGDHPLRDVEGAKKAGLHAYLADPNKETLLDSVKAALA